MEQENKRARAKYEKAERQRLFKLFEMAHDNDPRIKRELAEIEAEKQRKKEEAQQRKKQKHAAKEEGLKAAQERKIAEEKAKQDAIQAE